MNLKYSIYSSLYNAEKNLFNWGEAIQNFLDLADEVVIAINTIDNNTTLELVSSYFAAEILKPDSRLKLVDVKIDFSDPAFDGKLKNEALSKCTGNFATLLDMDERISLRQKETIRYLGQILCASENYDAFFLPVLNLLGDIETAENISFKWYIHKVKPNIKRGIFKNARVENSQKFDITKSDSTELIYEDGSLVKSGFLVDPTVTDEVKRNIIVNYTIPLIYHLGGLDIENRKRQDEFWLPVWKNRSHSPAPIDQKNYSAIKTFKHKLPFWKE